MDKKWLLQGTAGSAESLSSNKAKLYLVPYRAPTIHSFLHLTIHPLSPPEHPVSPRPSQKRI